MKHAFIDIDKFTMCSRCGRSVERVTEECPGPTEDGEDFRLLSLANEKGKFGLQLGEVFTDIQYAFERGIDQEWFTFVDVSPVMHAPDRLMRIFRLTDKGFFRLAVLQGKATP